jgi:hypothetical protein
MKMNPPWVALLVAVSTFVLAQPINAGIIHRYSFSESAGTTVSDSAGTANGELKGNGGYFDGAGHMLLPGLTRSDADSATIAGYVDLPNHMFNVLTNLTIESWVNWQGVGAWQRIFDFGTSAGGEDISNGNGNYLFLSPAGDVNLRFAVREPVGGTEPVQLTAANPLPTQEPDYVCVTVTYNYTANVSRLFTNGVLVASGSASVALSAINDVNNWLGRSQWGPDGMFQGNYDEFRIYDNAFNSVEVAASYLAGVAQPSTDPIALGAIQAVNLTVPDLTMTELDTQNASATADFANMPGVALGGVPGVTYTSGSPGFLTVDSTGLVTAVRPGTTTVTLSYGGMTDVETITVVARQTGIVVAGTLFVDLRATDAALDPMTWPNREGTGDFYGVGTPTYVADVAGSGVAGVQFNPVTPATDAYAGPVTTADLTGNDDCSIEVWAYNPVIADDETLVAWGHRGGNPDGSNMAFGYGANATWGAVGHWGSPDMGWSGPAPVAGQWHYLVYTYDGAGTQKAYADGVIRTTETPGTLSIWPDQQIRIGAQMNAGVTDFDFDQALSGYIAMVRVHTGTLSANDVANNFLYGPTLTPPGALQSVRVAASQTTLVGARAVGQAQLLANCANVQNLNVTGFSPLESSDPTVLTVDAFGVYVALKPGTATLSGTYQGMTATQLITVTPPPPLELKHRYSFSEAVGSTTVDDSVGTADGVVKGLGAAFDGAGRLSLPGGGSSAAAPDVIAGYVDLPNHIINPLVNVSIETWVTWQTSGSAWQRIFDFGTSAGGEDVSNGNGNYLFMSPQGDANLRFAVRDPRTGGEPTQCTSTAPLALGEEIYVAVSYNYTGNSAVLYSNAVQVATAPAAVPLNLIDDVNNWLGRAQWGDPMFQGTYNEFRIWEGALTADQVAAAYAAGPNQLPDVSPAPTITPSLSGSSLVLRWPATTSGFVLESTVLLGPPASWGAVDTSGAVDEGGQKVLTLAIDSATKFYRFRK